jgi:hypothetical protein
MSVAVARALGLDPSIATAMPARYAAALSAWRRHVVHARRQATAWRFTAVASTALCAALCASLFVALDRPPTLLSRVGTSPDALASLKGSAMTWFASVPATVPTASLFVLLAMLVMLTGCLVVSDRRFAARSLRARSHLDLTVSLPAPRTAAAVQRPARPPKAPASEAPTVPAHRWPKQACVPRNDIPIAAPAPIVSEATRRLDRQAATSTTGSTEPIVPGRTAAHPNPIRLRLSQTRRATRLRRRARLVANARVWAAPPDGTDTLIVTRAQHRFDEPPAAAHAQTGDNVPDTGSARGQSAPAPRGHPAMPPAQAERRVHRDQADATPDQSCATIRRSVPITAAEVDAIETYLGPVLRDLLASTALRRKDDVDLQHSNFRHRLLSCRVCALPCAQAVNRCGVNIATRGSTARALTPSTRCSPALGVHAPRRHLPSPPAGRPSDLSIPDQRRRPTLGSSSGWHLVASTSARRLGH